MAASRRETNGSEVDGKIVSSWRPDAGAKHAGSTSPARDVG
jgi:hypothetical protein